MLPKPLPPSVQSEARDTSGGSIAKSPHLPPAAVFPGFCFCVSERGSLSLCVVLNKLAFVGLATTCLSWLLYLWGFCYLWIILHWSGSDFFPLWAQRAGVVIASPDKLEITLCFLVGRVWVNRGLWWSTMRFDNWFDLYNSLKIWGAHRMASMEAKNKLLRKQRSSESFPVKQAIEWRTRVHAFLIKRARWEPLKWSLYDRLGWRENEEGSILDSRPRETLHPKDQL